MTSEEIKQLRKRLNMTQEELANKLGVSRQTVYHWEKNQKRPSRLAKKQLARLSKSKE